MKTKRITLAVLTMVLLLLTLTPQAQVTAVQSDYCDDTVKGICSNLQFAIFMSCMNQGGDYQNCKCRDLKAFNACMAEFGCPGKSEQFMIENGCGPD